MRAAWGDQWSGSAKVGSRSSLNVGSGSNLSAQDEILHRREIGKAFVALDVPEDRVEELQRLGREVLHVGVPRAIEARREEQPGVMVEQHEPRFVNGRDRQVVVPRPVTRTVLQRPDRFRRSFSWPGLTRKNKLNSLAEPTRIPGRDVPVEGVAKIFLLSARASRAQVTPASSGVTRCSTAHIPV